MKSLAKYVNVFQGCDTIDLPQPEGVAARWLFVKAQCGNTTPAAALPFGRMSVCAYTGGYPTGYGNRRPNSCGRARVFDAPVSGFSHLHVSGTGAIHAYYNFALTSAVREGLLPISERIVEERGEPGYYSATLSSGVKFEGSVSHRLAYHRYTLKEGGVIRIDFANCGLSPALDDFGRHYFDLPSDGAVALVSDRRVTARATFKGIPLYFAAEVSAADSATLWEDYAAISDKEYTQKKPTSRFGAAFCVGGDAVLRMAISFDSCEAAEKMLDSETMTFDEARCEALRIWEEYLGRVEVDTENEELLEIFYSNLYHSLVKPASGEGESFLYDVKNTDGKFYYDLGTLWDMYKTALPLIFTLYSKEGEGIAETLLTLTEKYKRSPINVTLAENNDCPEQARMLAEICLADYYLRGGRVSGERIVRATDSDLLTHTDFLESGLTERYTHVLDICDALAAVAKIARECNMSECAERFEGLSRGWRRVYDEKTGLLGEGSRYYEGDNYNYSFRLQHDMEERVKLCGREKFVSLLDGFFGFTREALEQSLVPELDPLSFGIHSFEGFNNESDMEAPYAYSFAGRHDRVCEVLSAAKKYMFTCGRGGLPGNNDSGALSSAYVWSFLGIHPVAGQDLMMIGTPSHNGATLKLMNGKTFKITVYDNNSSHIYVKKALLNGKEIENYRFSVRDMMVGGELELYMSESSICGAD